MFLEKTFPYSSLPSGVACLGGRTELSERPATSGQKVPPNAASVESGPREAAEDPAATVSVVCKIDCLGMPR